MSRSPAGERGLPQALCRAGWRIAAAALALAAAGAGAQVSVSAGSTLYNNANQIYAGSPSCSGCHVSPSAGTTNHKLASNNPSRIALGLATSGEMLGVYSTTPSTDQQFSMALYIGQIKLPIAGNSTLFTHAGFARAIDVYPLLASDGTGGAPQDSNGVTASNPANGSTSVSHVGSSAAAFAYNVTYTPDAGFVGADSFTYTATNPTGSDAGTISVTVYGVTSAASANLRAGAAGSYQITTNCSVNCALSGASPYSVVGTLPSGLSLNSASGLISGTPANTSAGSYPVTVRASMTVGGITRTIGKSVTLTVVGITSASSASATQNSAFAYSITTNGTPSGANPYSASGLPTGLAVNTASGLISGTPTLAVSTDATIGVVTTLGSVSKTLSINTAFAGIPVVGATPSSPSGNVNAAYPTVQINASNPPISSYGASGLPPGLSVNTGSGTITGTPTASGSFAATLSATNGAGTGSANLTFTVLPTEVPILSNATTVSTPQGSAYNDTIVASNPPITGYGGSGLPPGLSVNATSGAIGGTPTTSGVFNATLTASNVVGQGSLSVSFTILPTSVPVISSPTGLAGTANVALTPSAISASNPPVTGYGGSGLPPGVAVHPTSGVISGTPSAPGTYNATLSATNNAGTGTLVVVFTIGALPPTAGSTTLNVPTNGSATLDLATVISGFGVTGVSIGTPPSNGTLALGGTVVTYTPRHDFFGADRFTYLAYGTGGASTAGTVTINVTGRPDPTQNATVTGLVASLADASRRFARSQINNYQRRLEFLHRSKTVAPNGGGRLAPAGATDSGAGALAKGWSGIVVTPGSDGARTVPETTSESLAAATAAGRATGSTRAALDRLVQAATRSVDPNTPSPAMLSGVVELARSGRLDLSAVAGNVSPPDADRVGVWAAGNADFGLRTGGAGQAGGEFSSTGISAGADRNVGADLVLGVGVGYARNHDTIGSDGSDSIGTGTSFAVYGSYQPGSVFFDALLGFMALDFDNQRYVAAANDTARSERAGRQLFAMLATGYELKGRGVSVSPYARIEYSSDRIDGANEQGAGLYALSYGEQTGHGLGAALGVKLESIHPTGFGWVMPRLRAEFRHDREVTDGVSLAYADLPGTPFTLGADRRGRYARVFGIGTEFETRAGTRYGIEYQVQNSEAIRRGESLLLTVSKEFGGGPAHHDADEVVGKPLGLRVEAGFSHDDNVTRSRDEADRVADQTTSLAVSKSFTLPLTMHTRLWFNGALTGERSHHYEGLDRVSGNATAELQYRTSGAFDATTFALFLKAGADDYRSELRDGVRASAGVSMQQALTDRIGVFAALASNVRDATSAVFDTRDRSARLNLDYALEDGDTLYAGGELRRGDIVSSGRSSLDNVTIAEVLAADDAYPGRQFFAYRLDATTAIGTLGYNLRLGNRDSIDLSWRHVESKPLDRPTWSTAPERYIANQLSIFYLTRF